MIGSLKLFVKLKGNKMYNLVFSKTKKIINIAHADMPLMNPVESIELAENYLDQAKKLLNRNDIELLWINN